MSLTPKQERDLAIEMAGGIYASKAEMRDSLAKVRIIMSAPDPAKAKAIRLLKNALF